MFYPGIERKAEKLLESIHIQNPPVSINDIVENNGLDIKFSDLGENVSGVLAIQNEKGSIGVNKNESKVRQRFTLAHELGHYVLHSKKQNQLFIEDKMYRNEESSTGDLRREREANAFAAATLMPKELLKQEIEKHQLDIAHEDSIKKLAQIFKVSEVAMTYRVTNLKLI